MLTLYLVRHGQTDYSKNNRLCGTIDPPLNATGLAMAEALAKLLGDEPWRAIYASPLLRTRQTAQPTAERAGVSVQLDDGLREISYGDWEGMAESEVARTDSARFSAWAAHPGYVAPPGGESGIAIAARALAAVTRIRTTHTDGKVLVVSHKATLRVLLCALLGIDVDLFRARLAQKTAAISVVDFALSGPLLQVLGDISHLLPELSDGT
jgi:probable phosphoglycerate mutase